MEKENEALESGAAWVKPLSVLLILWYKVFEFNIREEKVKNNEI